MCRFNLCQRGVLRFGRAEGMHSLQAWPKGVLASLKPKAAHVVSSCQKRALIMLSSDSVVSCWALEHFVIFLAMLYIAKYYITFNSFYNFHKISIVLFILSTTADFPVDQSALSRVNIKWNNFQKNMCVVFLLCWVLLQLKIKMYTAALSCH